MRIAVIGMGALGTLFADALAPVADVAGVDRTSAPPHEIAPVDVALVCVKSPGTRWAADAAALLLANDGVAVTLQNGLGHLEVLAERLGPDRAAQGATSEGARREAGRVVRAGRGATVLAPHPAGTSSRARLEALAAVLERAGFPTRVVDDARDVVWRKLAVNAAINPLTALLRITNGALLEHPAAATADALAREIAAVARAEGIPFWDGEAVRGWREVAEATRANRSSMLQDVERGTPTEIDAICGAAAREGERLGVATPLCAAMTTLLA